MLMWFGVLQLIAGTAKTARQTASFRPRAGEAKCHGRGAALIGPLGRAARFTGTRRGPKIAEWRHPHSLDEMRSLCPGQDTALCRCKSRMPLWACMAQRAGTPECERAKEGLI